MINAKILVVDDDETISKTMKTVLEDEGFIVDLAFTGKEAIIKTQKNFYNIAILDVRLPDIEGVELLRLIKDTVPRTRKIIVTGYPTLQNAIASVNEQADAYLVKPFNVRRLLATIRTQLKLQEEERRFSEAKIAEFIERRAEALSTN